MFSVWADSPQCPCGCEQTLSQIQWTAWNINETGSAATGHYYLPEDYAHTTQYTVNPGSRIVLDLRGHTLTSEAESRLFLIYGDVSIIDTVGGGCLTAKATGKAVGGVLQIYYKNGDCGTLRLQNVTVMPHKNADGSGNGAKNGGLIYLGDDCTLELTGCTLFGGNADGSGGCVYAALNSQLRITDTTIFGCQASSNGGSIYSAGTVTVTNSRIWGGTAKNSGGNIYKTGGALTLESSDIAFGTSYGATSKYSGGNLCSIGNATVIVRNGTVLRDGYGAYAGGNAYIASGTQTFTDTTITGGVSQSVGANLACTSSSAVTTINNCQIGGDVHFTDGSLTLKGATKIGLGSNGLDLHTGSATLKLNASGLTQGAEIFVEANGVFTADAANKDYFKPALRTTAITTDSNGQLSAALAASGEMGGYCPHCYDPADPKTVAWSAFTGEIASGHYYLSDATSGQYNLPQDTDFVLDLNGKALTSGQRVFAATGANATLSILDGVGTGKLSGKGSNNGGGGVIYSLEEGFRLNIYGGRLAYEKAADKTVLSGSVVSMAGNNAQVNLRGGVLDGSAQDNTAGNYGGTLFLGNVGTDKSFTMSAGRLIGGNAQYGGTVYLGHYVNATITGGGFQAGTGTEAGGNLRVNGNSATNRSQLTIQNCMLQSGAITGAFNGGNAYFTNANATLENCYFIAGRSASAGGNLGGGAAATLSVKDTVFAQGNAQKGGNVYIAATNGENIFENCQFLGGTVTGGGANIYFNHGKNTLKGGKVAFGNAGGHGGNIYSHAGNHSTAGQFTKFTDAVLISGGTAAGNGGNLYTIGVTELDNVRFVSGTAAAGEDIYLAKGATQTQLTLSPGVTGALSMAVDKTLLTSQVYGGAISCTRSSGVNATIVLEGDYGEPGVLSKDNVLYVGGVALVDAQGSRTWYVNAEAAVADCGEDEYVKLYTSADLELTKDCAVDLNGQTVTVTGTGKLLGMDSSSDSFEDATGKAQWTGSVNTDMCFDAPNGYTYYAITEGSTVTYHRLHMALTDVVLRPGSVGLYFKGVWQCDSILAAQIQSYGIGLSLTNMPGADLLTDSDTLLVSYPGTNLSADTHNSVLVNNIFEEDATAQQNKTRGQMPIYATAYVEMKGGNVHTTDEAGEKDDIRYSLYSFLAAADRTISANPVKYRKAEKQLWEFCAKWQTKGAGSWKFEKIKVPVAPEDDDVMKILMIGQSHAQDTVWMLYDVLKAQMPDQEFLVVDVYRSVPLADHVANIKNQAAVYNYYANNSGAMVLTPNMTITEALVKENWDVIMFNEATWPQTYVQSYQNGNFEFMIGHIREYAQPGFRLAYNATWAQPVSAEVYAPERRQPPAGFRDTFTNNFGGSRLAHFDKICQNMKTYVETNEEFDIVFYSGTAIQYASETHGVPEGDPARIYDLYRDYTHLSDFGRLLVGYQLYAQIYGLEELTQVNVDLIPQHMRATEREQAFGDIVITQQHKDAIIASVNYALKNPHTAPPQLARENPILEPLS